MYLSHKHIYDCAMSAAILLPALALAQSYPERPVRVIVPFAAGGGSDLSSRQISARLTEHLGQQFVVDNRGGGGGAIGMEITARAAPDGYTILYSSGSYVAVLATRKSSYDLLKTLIPLVQVASTPYVIAVHPTLPASLKGLLDLARAKPGQINYASTGVGGLSHLATELLLNMAGVRITHVPYKGAGAALSDLIGGRSPILMTALVALMPHFQSGRLRPLATTGTQRVAELPDVPTAAETMPGYVVYSWYAMFAPGDTPRATVSRLNAVVNKILHEPEMEKNFRAQGLSTSGGSPETLGALVRTDYARWAKVVKENNITVEQ